VLAAFSASAQVLVGYQQRFFEKYGDGSTSGDSVPCCITIPATSMMATSIMATFDSRTTGANMGAYFAEFKNRTQNWYGVYNGGTGGVTLKQGAFTSMASLDLPFPGGNLRRLTTMLNRTVMDLVMRPNNGPGNFNYIAANNVPGIPTFRTTMTWQGPYAFQAGRLNVTAGPNRFGGTRNILHTQLSGGVDNGTVEGAMVRFVFAVQNGVGVPFTAMNIVRRRTAEAGFQLETAMTDMQLTGMVIFVGPGTGWFTILPYTTGTVQALANTLGTEIMDWTTRTDMGFENLNVTGMGGITGQLQLVSGHLLQSRGGSNTNLAGTNLTRITSTPEPASAALLGAGALGLVGLIIRDRRRSQI
jgi:PEP-CTERM motif